ncbi:MAG: hypothetical protein AAGD25_16000 [Cyanobacteria bacterium P01_F01_bin.150]
MKDIGVLILDDDQTWSNRHQKELTREKEFRLFPTNDAVRAVEIARERNIAFGLIDEILEVPPISQDGSGELQKLQGRGVIRKIREINSKTKFAFVTAAPIIWGKEDYQVSTQIVQSLRTSSPGVVCVINKSEINSTNSSLIYDNLIELIKQFSSYASYKNSIYYTGNSDIYLNQPGLIILENPIISSLSIDHKNSLQGGDRSSTNQIDSGDKTMSSNPHISFDGATIGAANINSPVHGDQVGKQYNNDTQNYNYSELALEIHQILLQMEKSHLPLFRDDDGYFVTEIKKRVEAKPQLKSKILAALQAGAAESLKQLCQHPAAEVAIAAFEGWGSAE